MLEHPESSERLSLARFYLVLQRHVPDLYTVGSAEVIYFGSTMQTIPSHPLTAIKAQFEAGQFPSRYVNNPELIVDDLYRLDNAWAGVMPNAPWRDRYERGFMASNFGPGSVAGRYGMALGASGTSLAGKVYDVLASIVKSGMATTRGGAAIASIIADGVKLDTEERRVLGNRMMAADASLAYNTANNLADLRQVMPDIAATYPEGSVRAGATQWIKDYDAMLSERGIASADNASPDQLAKAVPPGSDLSQKVKDAADAAYVTGGNDTAVEMNEFKKNLVKLGAQISGAQEQLTALQEQALAEVEKCRSTQEWGKFEARIQDARGLSSLGASFLSIAGDPKGAQQFQNLSQNGISLVQAFSKFAQNNALGVLDIASMATGVGCALAIIQVFSGSPESSESAMLQGALKAINERLEAIATELREVHILLADVYAATLATQMALTYAVERVAVKLDDFIQAYTDVERKSGINRIRLTAQKLQAGAAGSDEIELGLIDICSTALLEGSQQVHTRAVGAYGSSFVLMIPLLLSSNGVEEFSGLIADALVETAAFVNEPIQWRKRCSEALIPESERFNNMLDTGSNSCSPVLLTLALQECRAVLHTHPNHEPVIAPPALSSIDHYHRIFRANMWMCELYSEAKSDAIWRAAIVRVQVLLATMVDSLKQVYLEALKTHGVRAQGLPVEFLFGLNPFVCGDWASRCMDNLDTLIRFGLIDGVDIQDPIFNGRRSITATYISKASGIRSTATLVFTAIPYRAQTALIQEQMLELPLLVTAGSRAAGGDTMSDADRYSKLVPLQFHSEWDSGGAGVIQSDLYAVVWSTPENVQLNEATEADLAQSKLSVPRFPDLPLVAERAQSWAKESFASVWNNKDFSLLFVHAGDQIKRALVQCIALLKNKFPGMDVGGLMPSLSGLIAAANEDFSFDDIKRHFYGQDLKAMFLCNESPIPTRRDGVTKTYWIDDLTRMRKISDPNVHDAVKRKLWGEAMAEIDRFFSLREVSQSDIAAAMANGNNTRALPNIRSGAYYSPMREELQYQIAQSLMTQSPDW